MNIMPSPAVLAAEVPPIADPAEAVLTAAKLLLPRIAQGRKIDTATLRSVMEASFGAPDNCGAWDW